MDRSRRENISRALRERAARMTPEERKHPPDCGHCRAVRGKTKPPFSQEHKDHLSASHRKGGEPSYHSMHQHRIRRDRGKPSDYTCRCGRPAQEWAFMDAPPEFIRVAQNGKYRVRFSVRSEDYEAMCRSCHRQMDSDRCKGRVEVSRD